MSTLKKNQVEELSRLYEVILRYAERERPAAEIASRDLEVSNIFGIFGPRGAGKTTLLSHVKPRFQEPVDTELKKRLENLIFPSAIDCSSLRQEIHPGMAVLLSLRKVLRGEDHSSTAQKKIAALDSKKREALEEKLNQLVGRYSQVGQSYHDFCSEISSTTEDRVHYINQGLQSRMELGDELMKWIGETLHTLESKGFVILLDDLDLVNATQMREWMLTLLDEFRQPGMFFVLAADFYRLSHLSWDAKEHLDDKTGRALLDKLLPLQNCIYLSAWSAKNRKSYKPRPEAKEELEKHVCEQMHGQAVFQLLEPLIFELLPRWPRGLQNLYESLSLLTGKEVAEPESVTTPDVRLQRFLGFLARSRGEQLLARRLDEVELRSWVVTLTFKDEDLPLEDWQTAVELAGQRTLHREESLESLPGLEPILKDDPHITQRTRTVEISDLWSRAPGAPDPLRHDLLHVLPLRDAEPADQALWTELLIDAGFLSVPQRRADFLVRWAPTHQRSERCGLDQRFSRRELRSFFQENTGALSVDVLAWLREDGSDAQGERVRIGWEPLLESLRGARTFWSSRLAKTLIIRPDEVRPRAADKKSFDPARLLPSQLWALILFVDHLDRCPWRTFSVARGWFVSTYLCLAAAFVRSAYVAALACAEVLPEDKLSNPQLALVDILRRRDPSALLNDQEEELLSRLRDLFEDRLAEKLESAEDALSQAAYAYLTSPWYEAIVALLKSQKSIQESGQDSAS